MYINFSEKEKYINPKGYVRQGKYIDPKRHKRSYNIKNILLGLGSLGGLSLLGKKGLKYLKLRKKGAESLKETREVVQDLVNKIDNPSLENNLQNNINNKPLPLLQIDDKNLKAQDKVQPIETLKQVEKDPIVENSGVISKNDIDNEPEIDPINLYTPLPYPNNFSIYIEPLNKPIDTSFKVVNNVSSEYNAENSMFSRLLEDLSSKNPIIEGLGYSKVKRSLYYKRGKMRENTRLLEGDTLYLANNIPPLDPFAMAITLSQSYDQVGKRLVKSLDEEKDPATFRFMTNLTNLHMKVLDNPDIIQRRKGLRVLTNEEIYDQLAQESIRQYLLADTYISLNKLTKVIDYVRENYDVLFNSHTVIHKDKETKLVNLFRSIRKLDGTEPPYWLMFGVRPDSPISAYKDKADEMWQKTVYHGSALAKEYDNLYKELKDRLVPREVTTLDISILESDIYKKITKDKLQEIITIYKAADLAKTTERNLLYESIEPLKKNIYDVSTNIISVRDSGKNGAIFRGLYVYQDIPAVNGITVKEKLEAEALRSIIEDYQSHLVFGREPLNFSSFSDIVDYKLYNFLGL